ncbi:MAG: SdrD B-like domain-containing protein [Patescibacteria group bacterium]
MKNKNTIKISIPKFQTLTTSLAVLLFIVVTVTSTVTIEAAFRSFTPRFQTTTTGNIAIIGNTLVTCPVVTVNDSCDQAKKGLGGTLNNNSYNMIRVDTDSDTTTNNSSSAQLNIPNGSSVLFAGLYISGRSTSAARLNMKLDTPASTGYLNLTSQQDDTSTTGGGEYMEFVNVTNQVATSPNGIYTTSAGLINSGPDGFAGWALVVVYSNPNEPMRDLNVFDGFNNAPANINISGFKAPNAAPVAAQVGIVSFEGDRGVTGDKATLNGTDLTNGLNPANNFFNSTISNNGIQVPNLIPGLVNTMGTDIDMINTSGIITPGSTSATLNLSTTGDQFYSGVGTFAIEVQAPKLQIAKSMIDINGGNLMIGDELEVTLNINSNGLDTAANAVITDLIPSTLTYVPNSINYVSGFTTGPQTDSVDNDGACFNSVTKEVRMGLGNSPAQCNGGNMAIGTSAVVKFKVKVATNVTDGQLVVNTATGTFRSNILQQNYTVQSNQVSLPVLVPPTRLTGNVYNDPNNNATKDTGETGVIGVVVNILDPITNVVLYTINTDGVGNWSVDVAPGNYKIQIVPPTGFLVTGNTNNNSVSVAQYQTLNAGIDGLNNLADLSIQKISCGLIIQGDLCSYTLKIKNNGPGLVRRKVIVTDTLPIQLQYLSATQVTGGYNWLCTAVGQMVTCELDQDIPVGTEVEFKLNTKVI